MTDLWYKHKSACEYLGVGEKWLYDEGNKGRVRRIRIAAGYRYRESALDAYLVLLEQEQNDTKAATNIRRIS